ILKEDARAFPPSHARTREMLNRILRINRDQSCTKKLVFFLSYRPVQHPPNALAHRNTVRLLYIINIYCYNI
ncbi:hypothetical protein BU23DRAFT_480075, partial [Bimuria novae-zelandiae CBS 107.79]